MAAFTMAYTLSIIIPLLYCLLQGSISEDGRCGDRCCTNFREIDGKCVECIGSFGLNCISPCPPNHYGGRCADKCVCVGAYEVCNPVHGCCQNTDPKCQQKGVITEKEVHVEDESLSYTLTGIFIFVSVTILMLSCLVSIYVWIRQERRMTKTKPKSAKAHGESNATTRNVKESSYDDIQALHVIMDENITTL